MFSSFSNKALVDWQHAWLKAAMWLKFRFSEAYLHLVSLTRTIGASQLTESSR